jgi:hypothetical protein
VVLNTVIEHNFQDELKKKSTGSGDYFEGDGDDGSKLVFDQMAAPVPKIMDTIS